MGLIPIFCSILTLTAREIRKILSSLENAVVIHTDTVIGILSTSTETIEKIKGRKPGEKKIVKLIGSEEAFGKDYLPEGMVKIMEKWWPGPLTIIFEGCSYRMPADDLLLDVLLGMNYVYASSANITNEKIVTSIEEARKIFKGENIYFVENIPKENKYKRSNIPSTIFDYDNKKILREGSIRGEEILNLVRKN